MFPDLAFEKLLNTAPELTPFILTFKDMTSDLGEESIVNVGVFIINLGGNLLFIPVIAKSDIVYPIDSVFLDSEKKFFPLTKSLVNYFISSGSTGVGGKTKIPTYVDRNPNIHELVNPPKTGKYAYASSGILPEFLAQVSPKVKEYFLGEIEKDASFRNSLHNVFGLENILPSLEITKEASVIPAITGPYVEECKVITSGTDLKKEQIDSILDKGYAVLGHNSNPRIAVPCMQSDPYQFKFQEISAPEQGKVYSIYLKNGESRFGWLPIFAKGFGISGMPVAIFDDGTWTRANKFVATPESLSMDTFLKGLLCLSPPLKLQHVTDYSSIAILDPSSLNLIGIFRIARVNLTSSNGARIEAEDCLSFSKVYLNIVSSFKGPIFKDKDNYFLPAETIAIRLNSGYPEVQTSINAAADMENYKRVGLLSEVMDIRHDGFSFSINGSLVGDAASIMKALVEHERLDPYKAEEFIKQAKVAKKIKIYLSKRAAFDPMINTGLSVGAYPGSQPKIGPQTVTQDNTDINIQDGVAKNNIAQSLALNDEAVGEATIISELLQDPMMFETITNYLPVIEEALDKLGRTLFLMRLRSEEISQQLGTSTVSSLLTSIKNSYRTLGDNYMKLKLLLANTEPDTNQKVPA